MAHVEPALAFDSFSGKLSRKERIVMRTRANARFIGTKTDKYYSTLRGFIIASLSVQFRSA